MKLIYTLTLLLFSSSVFAEFVYVKSSISDLLNYGFRIEQIDTIKHGMDVVSVYHLKVGTNVAICTYGAFYAKDGKSRVVIQEIVSASTGKTLCTVDTQDKSLIELLNENYLKQLIIEDIERNIERNKELLAEEMDD